MLLADAAELSRKGNTMCKRNVIGKISGFTIADVKKNTTLFYAAFFMMVFAKAFGLFSADRSYYIMFAAAATLLLIRILISLKSWDTLIRVCLVLAPGAIVFLHNRETTLLFTCLFLAASKDVDFETSMKGALIACAAAIPLRVMLYFLGVVEGGTKPIISHDNMGNPYIVGYTKGYGFVTPNMLFAAVFIAVLLLLYVRRNKLNFTVLAIVSAITVGVFWITKCKTGMVVYAAVLGALLLGAVFPNKKSLIKAYCLLMIAGSIILGAVVPLIYSVDNPVLFLIDEYLLSGRLLLSNNALKEMGVTLLGKGDCFLDILYMDVLLNCGLLGFAALLCGFCAAVWCFVKQENMMGLICISAMILYACMEQFPLNIAMNPFLLYLGTNVIFTSKVKT